MGTWFNPLKRGVQYQLAWENSRSTGCCGWKNQPCDSCCDDEVGEFSPKVEYRGDLSVEDATAAMQIGYLGKALLEEFGGDEVEGTTVNAQGEEWVCERQITHFTSGRVGWFKSTSRQECAVVFRGSANAGDWFQNLESWTRCLDSSKVNSYAGCEGKVHNGFKEVYENVIEGNVDEYNAFVKGCNDAGYKLIFGGQSLGGALATIAGWSMLLNINPVREWTYDSSKIKIYTTGAPRVVNEGKCPDIPDNTQFRLVRMEEEDRFTDPVPMVVAGFSHCIGGYGIRADGSAFWNPGQYFPKAADYSNGWAVLKSLSAFNNWHSLAFKGGYLDRLILRVTGYDWRVTGGNIAVENPGFVVGARSDSEAGFFSRNANLIFVAVLGFAVLAAAITATLVSRKKSTYASLLDTESEETPVAA